MHYRLSSRQAKDLLLNRKPLTIALPAPIEEPEDWLAWARGAILDHGELITSAEPDMIDVAPNPHRSGLEGYLGAILTEGDPAQTLTLSVDVVVCELRPSGRGKPAEPCRLQWPGTAVRGDAVWPPKRENTNWKKVAEDLLSRLKAHRHACSDETKELINSVEHLLNG
jgi:hypothetical protein